jgi:hypothetical protein
MRLLALLGFLTPALALAGPFTNTLPAGVFLVDERVAISSISNQWTNDGEFGPLIDEIERYEPGGGLQGTILPDAKASYTVLVNMLGYGVTDSMTALVAIPVVLSNTVQPRLGWRGGDYSSLLGRSYTNDDFWEWAGSMGQPKPGRWNGNQGAVSDIVLGVRYRFSDHIDLLRDLDLSVAGTVFGALPTGNPPAAEEVVAAGTTSWDLHTQGQLGFHLAADKALSSRVTVGLDLFYEVFFPQERDSGTGEINPLLLNQRPFVGDTYTIDPGDFTGATVGVEVVAWRGPAWGTWLVGGDPSKAEGLPPLLTIGLQYNFTWVAQSDYQSNSTLWDWQQEEFWLPGYKNILLGSVNVSLLRLGVPLNLYGAWRTLTLLPGKNVRAPNVLFLGVQLPLKFW